MNENTKSKKSAKARVLDIIGLILCILLLPIVVINMTMAIQGIIQPDTPPNFMGYTPLIVGTGSMSPAFDASDLVIVKAVSDSANLEEGDIISYFSGETLITHRIIGHEIADDQSVMYITQGDANNTPDTVRVAPAQIFGTYVTHFENLGAFALFMQTPLGMLLFVVIPLILLFAIFYANDHRRYKKAMAEKDSVEAAAATGSDSHQLDSNSMYSGVDAT